jgi:phage terminase large subunit
MDFGGFLTVTLTPLKRAKWVRDLETEPGAETFRASMREAAAAGLLDRDEVERYARSLPERQRRVRVDGDFVSLEGAVYPDLHRHTHVAKPSMGQLKIGDDVLANYPLPASWPRWASIDWGYVNPTACILAAQCPSTGRIYVERCYYASGIRAGAWAPMLKDRLPPLRVPLISDHDAQARSELQYQGIPTSAADKEVDTGLEAVERVLSKTLEDGHPALVFILDGENDRTLGRCDAEKVLWEAELYHYAPAREGRPDVRDAPVKKDDHAMDALRYLVVACEKSKGGAPRPPRLSNYRRKSKPSNALALSKELWL